MQWLNENWVLVAFAASVLLSVINGLIVQYPDAKWIRPFRVVLDLLSWIVARDASGSVKLPGARSK